MRSQICRRFERKLPVLTVGSDGLRGSVAGSSGDGPGWSAGFGARRPGDFVGALRPKHTAGDDEHDPSLGRRLDYKPGATRTTRRFKILPTRLADNPDARLRFQGEAKAISSLQHPNICTLYDIGSENGVDFLVMECLEGETLQDRLRQGLLPLEQVTGHAMEIADASMPRTATVSCIAT